MENLVLRYVFDRKGQASNSKEALLQIEVRLSGTFKKTYISTGIRLYKNQFSNKNGFTCVNHPNSQIITGKAKKIFNKIEAFVNSKECTSLKYVHEWDKDLSKIHLVVEFIEKEITKHNLPKEHKSLLSRLKEFEEIKTFSDLTYENIVDFDLHLRKTIKSQPILYKRHNTLKRHIKEAIKRKMCTYNPYDDDFQVKKGKSNTC